MFLHESKSNFSKISNHIISLFFSCVDILPSLLHHRSIFSICFLLISQRTCFIGFGGLVVLKSYLYCSFSPYAFFFNFFLLLLICNWFFASLPLFLNLYDLPFLFDLLYFHHHLFFFTWQGMDANLPQPEISRSRATSFRFPSISLSKHDIEGFVHGSDPSIRSASSSPSPSAGLPMVLSTSLLYQISKQKGME